MLVTRTSDGTLIANKITFGAQHSILNFTIAQANFSIKFLLYKSEMQKQHFSPYNSENRIALLIPSANLSDVVIAKRTLGFSIGFSLFFLVPRPSCNYRQQRDSAGS